MNRTLLKVYQLGAGLSDTATGLLLIVAPAWTLRLMGIAVAPNQVVFVSFVGVFVLSVGLTYLAVLAAGSLVSLISPNLIAWRTQWQLTALVRGLVALFLFFEIARGHMEARWMIVAVSDGMLAFFQIVGLTRGWLFEEAQGA